MYQPESDSSVLKMEI